MSRILKVDATGPDVVALQNELKTAGFSPGVIDGQYGQGTLAAVLAFQRSEHLVADGVVGPHTAKLLQLAAVPPPPPASPDVTLQVVAKMFPQTPLGNIKANLPIVLGALNAADLDDKPMVLMALSTIRAETASFEPISEFLSRFNTSPGGTPFDLYDNRSDLGNTGPPDGADYCGRGFVQLTGRSNYARYSKEIGQDLVGDPRLANDPTVAAELLARFLKDREKAIRQAVADNDLRAARKLVNGGSNGLAVFEEAFNIGNSLIPDPA